MTWKTTITTAVSTTAREHSDKATAMAAFNAATDRPEVRAATIHHGAMLWATWRGAGTTVPLTQAISEARRVLADLERKAARGAS